jgi:hypothetical protein
MDVKIQTQRSACLNFLAGHNSRETILIVLLLALFLGVNLWTATQFPVPWMDEVQFVDPAANLYFKNSFTTTAYGWEQGTELHAHHPLYSLLLASWFEITGFGLAHARALNYVLVICTVLTVWVAVARAELVPSAAYRVFLILLLLFGYSTSFPYRTGRIEPLLMFLSAVLFLLFTIDNRRWRIGLLASCTLLFAPAGLHLVVFAGVFTFLLLIYLGRQVLVEVIVIWAALLISAAGLFTFYAIHGVWQNAIVAIAPHTASGGIGTFLTGGGLTHVNKLPKDPSSMVLLALLGLLIIDQIRRGRFRWGSVLSFGLASSIAVPVASLILAKFPTYYSWMVFGPLSVCVCSVLSRMKAGALVTVGVRSGLVLACITGLPLQLLAVTYDWRDRDYDAVHRIVTANVEKDDRVLCDYQVYFAAKAKALEVFLPQYVKLMSTEEKRSVTLLIGSDEALTAWRSRLGGEWNMAAEGIVPTQTTILQRLTGKDIDVGLIGQKYRFKIYKRAG